MSLRIAIPTDFSQNAERAARFIIEFFREEECVFFLLHTYTPAFFRAEYLLHSPGQIGLGDFYKERVLRKLKSFEKQLKAVCAEAQHQFYVHAAFNNLDAELNDMARKERLDLIVMGTQGATGAKEILFGTHAVQVLHKAEVPVLVVPAAARPDDVNCVLFPTDYAPDYSLLNFKALERILDRSSATVHVLHAYSEADARPERKADKEKLSEVLQEYPQEWHEIGQKGVIAAIDEFAGKQEVHLLVMVRNRHTVLEQLLVTPVIDQIGFHTEIPFLVIPPEDSP